jgi:hypothetical protein
MAFVNPQVADFKGFFVRDFVYSTDINLGITDTDIAVSFTKVNPFINPEFFGDQTSYSTAYLLLAAHFMVLSIRRSSQGLNSQAGFILSGKGVGPVNSTFAIPQRILDNPELANLCKTGYGEEYIMGILPQLTGALFAAPRMTLP